MGAELQARVYTRTNENGIHYVRVITPKQLRVFLSKPALWRSLATKNNKEAVININNECYPQKSKAKLNDRGCKFALSL